MHHRNRGSPVALARDQPVADAVPHRRTADRGDVVEQRDVEQRQTGRLGEPVIAFVVRRNAHHHAGSVVLHHVVGRDDGNRVTGEWVARVATRSGVSRRDREEAHGGQRVGARRKDREHVVGDRQLEVDLRSLGATDPSPLQSLGALGPVELLQSVEQPIGIARDPQEPLPHDPLADDGAAPLARSAVEFGLLASEDREARRTPQHRCFRLVGEPGAEQLREQPLRPSVVGGPAGVEAVPPVPSHTAATQLGPKALRRPTDEVARMRTDAERVVLSIDAKGIPPHRLEDGAAADALRAPVRVDAGVPEDVANVQPLGRRVRKFAQVVELRRRVDAFEVDQCRTLCLPALSPARLDLMRVVGHSSGHRVVRLRAVQLSSSHSSRFSVRQRKSLPTGRWEARRTRDRARPT